MSLTNKRFTLTRKAKDDLKAIAAYTQQKWGKEQRATYLKQFDLSFHMLSDNAGVGTECDYIKLGYRKFPCGGHLIFYRNIALNKVEIVRILHKRMDVSRQLLSP